MAADDATTREGERLIRLGQAILLLFGALLAASLAVQVGSDLLAGVGFAATDTVAQIGRTLFQFAAFAAVVALFLYVADDHGILRFSVPDRRQALLAVGSVVVLLAVQYGLLAVLSSVGVLPVQNRAIDPATHAPAYFLAMVFVSVLVVGPAEELLFRGAIQGVLRRGWGVRPAIVGASLLFGLIHYSVGAGTPGERLAYVAIAFLLGGMLGYLYEYTGNLVVPAVAHGGYNAVAFATQYLEAVGYVG